MLPDVAVMVELPCATAIATPLVGTVSLIVATAVADEVQVTLPVMSWVLLSSYVPTALNDSLVFTAIDGLAGVMAMETSVGFTCNVAEPVIDPDTAEIVVEPLAFVDTSPPAATVATSVADEFHLAELLRSLDEPSLNVPRAVNCSVVFAGSDKLSALT